MERRPPRQQIGAALGDAGDRVLAGAPGLAGIAGAVMDRLAEQDVGHRRLDARGRDVEHAAAGTGGVAHRQRAADRRTGPAFGQDRIERRRPALQQRVLRGVPVGVGRGVARPHLVADHVGERQQALQALAVVVVGGRRQQAVAEFVEQAGAGFVQQAHRRPRGRAGRRARPTVRRAP